VVVRTRRRTTRWNLFFNYVSIGFGLVSGILMVPLNLRFIPIDMYGAWLASGNVLVWLTAVDPGLSTVLQQLVANAYGRGDRDKISALIWSGIAISAVLVAILGIIGAFLIPELPIILNLPASINWPVLRLACVIELIASVVTIFGFALTSSNIGLQASLGPGLVYVAVNIVSVIVQACLLFGGFGLSAIPWASLVRGSGMLAGSIVYLGYRMRSEKYRVRPVFSEVKAVLRVVSFTFFGRAANVLSANLDSVFVARILGPGVVPILRLTRSPIDICANFIQRPAAAMAPAVAHVVGAGEVEQKREVLVRFTAMASWTILLACAGFVSLNHAFLRLWVGQRFFAGATVNSALVANCLMMSIVGTMSVLTFALGDIKKSTLISGFQSLLTIGLLYLGARYGGLLGVALAPLTASMLLGGWYQPMSFARRAKLDRHQISAALREFLKSAVAAVVAAAIGCLLHPRTWLDLGLSVAAVVASFFCALGAISGTFRTEIKAASAAAGISRNKYLERYHGAS
jgi:O-antigen/teichoic acid export membrane protein